MQARVAATVCFNACRGVSSDPRWWGRTNTDTDFFTPLYEGGWCDGRAEVVGEKSNHAHENIISQMIKQRFFGIDLMNFDLSTGNPQAVNCAPAHECHGACCDQVKNGHLYQSP